MDRWIRTAWNAFWVGLGASAVLVGQSVLAPAAPPAAPSPAAEPPAAPLVAPAPPAAAKPMPHAPIFSRAATPRCLVTATRC